MIYANQFAYDNATEPELSDYTESQQFAEFVECVTLDILKRIDRCGIDSQILMFDVEQENGGYQMAAEMVAARLTEEQFNEWING